MRGTVKIQYGNGNFGRIYINTSETRPGNETPVTPHKSDISDGRKFYSSSYGLTFCKNWPFILQNFDYSSQSSIEDYNDENVPFIDKDRINI